MRISDSDSRRPKAVFSPTVYTLSLSYSYCNIRVDVANPMVFFSPMLSECRISKLLSKVSISAYYPVLAVKAYCGTIVMYRTVASKLNL
jgi:hypothetical protein